MLRTFADISGLNIVIDPTIQGTVDVSLKEVPWDQALDIILKANKLGYAVDGTVVRIAPLAVLSDEEAQRRKLAEAQALSGELRVLTRPLSYAKAQDLVPIVTSSALSQRGEVQVDARTNTLIIRDLPDRLTAANDLIGTLDSPQPQVEIEARIVQTSRDFARALGVQWGFNGVASPGARQHHRPGVPEQRRRRRTRGRRAGPARRADGRQPAGAACHQRALAWRSARSTARSTWTSRSPRSSGRARAVCSRRRACRRRTTSRPRSRRACRFQSRPRPTTPSR